MGFYLELRRTGNDPVYRETEIPASFWFLFAIGGFALACMGGAAATVMWELASKGAMFDRVILFAISLFVPLYLLAGIKLAWIRKYLAFDGDRLEIGHRWGQYRLFRRSFLKENIVSFDLLNERQSPNLAPAQHDDRQYYIRGHWRLLAKFKDGRTKKLDCHTEREALTPLLNDLKHWLKH